MRRSVTKGERLAWGLDELAVAAGVVGEGVPGVELGAHGGISVF